MHRLPFPFDLGPVGWSFQSFSCGWVGSGSILGASSNSTPKRSSSVLTTFIAASSAMLSFLAVQFFRGRTLADLASGVNGTLMGLIVITPLAGFVSPSSSLILGLMCGPIFAAAEGRFARLKWLSDPVGLLPGHLVGGLFGVVMIPLFAQRAFATGSGYPNLPNGLFFGGGTAAVHQLGVEVLGIVVVVAFVFTVSFVIVALIARASHGITTSEQGPTEAEEPSASTPGAWADREA